MKVALDTNILVYAEGCWVDPAADRPKTAEVRRILDRLPTDRVAIPFNVLPELFGVLRRKGRYSGDQARSAVRSWMAAYTIISAATPLKTLVGALDLAADRGLSIMDAMILSSAIESDCDILLTEDMGHATKYGRLSVLNPVRGDTVRSLRL